MKLNELNSAIKKSWKKETCYPPLKDKWSEDNPSVGQSAVTALIVNDFFGGKIMRCKIIEDTHYFNIIDNKVIDLTKEETLKYESIELSSKEDILSNEDTRNRYLKFLKNIKESFIKYGEKEYLLLDKNNEMFTSKYPGLISGNQKAKIYGKHNCLNTLGWIKRGGESLKTIYFEDEEIAKEIGYRPCKECFPNQYKDWQKTLKITYNK